MENLKHIQYTPTGVCSKVINFDLSEDGKIYNLKFTGGCPGNLSAISKLLEGADAKHAAEILANNTCGPRQTSCADQLSKAILSSLKDQNA
jgi:uncharacterized protein (TIGR03905 family)